MRRLLAAGAAVLVLAACGGAEGSRTNASSSPARHPQPAPAKPARVPGPVKKSDPGAPQMGIGNVPGCLGGADPTPYLREFRATVLRAIVTPLWGGLGSNGEAVPCLRAAKASGYRVHLVIQYSNVWDEAQTVAYFKQVLSYYGRFAWAVSIGNEQELFQGGPGRTGRRYAEDWQALEPVVAHLAPQAIRVAGEISPWGWTYLKRAVRAGLPGAQVLAAHVYTYRFHFAIPDFEDWARSLRLPYWFTEGAYIPGSKAPVVPVSQLAGAPVIESWLDY